MAIASRMASRGDGKICPCKMRASKVCRKRVVNCTVVRASAKMCAVLSNGSGYMRPAVCIWCLKSTGPSATACTGTFAGLHCPLWAAFVQKQVVASGCHAISAGRGRTPGGNGLFAARPTNTKSQHICSNPGRFRAYKGHTACRVQWPHRPPLV